MGNEPIDPKSSARALAGPYARGWVPTSWTRSSRPGWGGKRSFGGRPPWLYALLDESVLRRPVGPIGVVRQQLEHLLAKMQERTGVLFDQLGSVARSAPESERLIREALEAL